jgi:hypothetical protein
LTSLESPCYYKKRDCGKATLTTLERGASNPRNR